MCSYTRFTNGMQATSTRIAPSSSGAAYRSSRTSLIDASAIFTTAAWPLASIQRPECLVVQGKPFRVAPLAAVPLAEAPAALEPMTHCLGREVERGQRLAQDPVACHVVLPHTSAFPTGPVNRASLCR